MVSVVTLLIGATTVLSALQTLLQQIWKSEALSSVGIRGWIRTRFLSLGFILALGFLLLVSLTISTGLSMLRKHIGEQHSAAVGLLGAVRCCCCRYSWSRCCLPLSSVTCPRSGFLGSRWRLAASVTAALFDVGRWAVGVYLAHSTQPSAFGAAASFATLLLWLYYTSLIFLFGAEYTACLGGLRHDADAVSLPAKREYGE